MTSYEKIRAYLLRAASQREADTHDLRRKNIPEDFVQYLWFTRKLLRTVKTTDGQTVKMIQPGLWNRESGPDFKNAVIRIGDATVVGDVEIHLHPRGWQEHGHDRDPAYESVILHVAFAPDKKEFFTRTNRHRFVPTVIVSEQLSEPLEFLLEDYDPDTSGHTGQKHEPAFHENGRCAEVIGGSDIRSILDEAGRQRFLEKAARWARVAKSTSLRQAIWEGTCEALGYKKNKLPMRLIARESFGFLSEGKRPPQERLAILMGLAGFLPHQLPESGDRDYVSGLWNVWWKHRAQFAPAERGFTALWRFDGIRPVNHPHRRVAAAALLWDLLPKIEKAVTSFPASLDDMDAFPMKDGYWNHHHTLTGKRSSAGIALVGADRWTQIKGNILYPLAHAFAKSQSTRENLFTLFTRLPSSDNDQTIRAACQRLGLTPRDVRGHLRKQGLHQIYRDFCLADASDCANCPFPKMVAAWDNH